MSGLRFTVPLVLILASCAAPQTQFNDMSGMELLAYNRSVDYSDQVSCTDQVDTGSHIRRRSCQTHRDTIEGRPSSLSTPSSNVSLRVGPRR